MSDIADKLRKVKLYMAKAECECEPGIRPQCVRCYIIETFPDPDAVGELENTNAELRGLIAECLALTPSISGDMEKVLVWNDVVRRMRAAALAKLEKKT